VEQVDAAIDMAIRKVSPVRQNLARVESALLLFKYTQDAELLQDAAKEAGAAGAAACAILSAITEITEQLE
jgi:hypothetical protein